MFTSCRNIGAKSDINGGCPPRVPPRPQPTQPTQPIAKFGSFFPNVASNQQIPPRPPASRAPPWVWRLGPTHAVTPPTGRSCRCRKAGGNLTFRRHGPCLDSTKQDGAQPYYSPPSMLRALRLLSLRRPSLFNTHLHNSLQTELAFVPAAGGGKGGIIGDVTSL